MSEKLTYWENVWKNAQYNAELKINKMLKLNKLSRTSREIIKQKIKEKEEINVLKQELKKGTITKKKYFDILELIKWHPEISPYIDKNKRYKFELTDFFPSKDNNKYNEYLEIKLKRILKDIPTQAYAGILRFFYYNLRTAACKTCGWIHYTPDEFGLEYLTWHALHDGPFPLEHFFEKNINDCHLSGVLASYRGSDWKERRQHIFELDNFKCVICSSEYSLEVHHILPYRLVHCNKDENLITLCKSCHSKVEPNLNGKLNFELLPNVILKDNVFHWMILIGEKNWNEVFNKMWDYVE